MDLPDAHLALVEQEKICGYLLNPAHPDNGGKADFFAALGFQIKDWQALAAALRDLAQRAPVVKRMASPHGTKYILDGRIGTPGGKQPWVRTVWIVDRDGQKPRLVTAYPRQD
jgi:hypothetical protein